MNNLGLICEHCPDRIRQLMNECRNYCLGKLYRSSIVRIGVGPLSTFYVINEIENVCFIGGTRIRIEALNNTEHPIKIERVVYDESTKKYFHPLV